MQISTLFNSSLTPFLAQQEAMGTTGMISQLMIWVLLFGGMYFLLIAPNRKRQKEQAKMLSELTSGDSVMTNSGIYGTITNVKDDRFVIKIADNTKIEVNKSFIQNKFINDK